jgi:hypothetical protein
VLGARIIRLNMAGLLGRYSPRFSLKVAFFPTLLVG